MATLHRQARLGRYCQCHGDDFYGRSRRPVQSPRFFEKLCFFNAQPWLNKLAEPIDPSELHDLIDDYIEGKLSDANAARLSQLLEQSAEARAQYWEAASIHGLLEHVIQGRR